MRVIPSAATGHAERSDGSCRAQRRVMPSAATGHAERSEESKRVAHDPSRCSVTMPDVHRSLI
ncbi:MAG: hypothetical protein KatS3mg058_4594 [Roseiflexus sp.]|nr:MAG: hypothetical protein KatS3mg058_4594 [Roseiflexus sp.]